MTLRWLTGSEAVDKLNPLIAEQGWTPLNDQTCRVLVAEDEGVMLGFFVLQLFPFLGPLYAHPGEGAEVMFALQAEMRKYIEESVARGFLVIADNPVTDKLCQREGLRRVESPVYLGPKLPGVVM